MTPQDNEVNTENETHSGAAGAGCLTWSLWAAVVGVALSLSSIVWSVDYSSGGVITIGSSGFLAGFPVSFVDVGGGNLDANDPPSTIFQVWALGGSIIDFSWIFATINAIVWVFFALVVAAIARLISRLPP